MIYFFMPESVAGESSNVFLATDTRRKFGEKAAKVFERSVKSMEYKTELK